MQIIIGIIKYILASNIINFCLMIWLLFWLCKKFNIVGAFNSSIKSIEDYIEKSKSEKANANKLVKESEELIARLPHEIEEIENLSMEKTKIFMAQLEERTQKSIDKISSDIDEVKAIDEKITSNHIMGYSFNKSVKRAESKIIETLKSNPDLHYKFIDKSLNELDRIQL